MSLALRAATRASRAVPRAGSRLLSEGALGSPQPAPFRPLRHPCATRHLVGGGPEPDL